jgi:hypothetical protein
MEDGFCRRWNFLTPILMRLVNQAKENNDNASLAAKRNIWSAASATGNSKQEAWSAASATGSSKQEAWSAAGTTGI